MKDKQFERFFKDALGKYEAPYDPSAWSAMEKQLDARPNNYLWLKAGEIALVCAAVWFMANPLFNKTPKVDEKITPIVEQASEDLKSENKNLVIDKLEQKIVESEASDVLQSITSSNKPNNKNVTEISKVHERLNQPLKAEQSLTDKQLSQLEKDMKDYREHLASQEIYALNIAFNIKGESFTEEEKALILADINERSANSMARLSEFHVASVELDNDDSNFDESSIASLELQPLAQSQVIQNMMYGLEYAPDVLTNDYASTFQSGNTYGFNMKYKVNDKLRLVTGAHYYSFRMENPGFCMEDVNDYSGTTTLVSEDNHDIGLSSASSNNSVIGKDDCFSKSEHFKRQIEIPFEADFKVNQINKLGIYMNAGVSMYLINREYFNYHLVDNSVALRDDGDFTEILNNSRGPESSKFTYFEKDEAGHVKIGLGLEYQLQPSVGLRLQPQLKLPVSFENGFSTNLMRYSLATGLYYHF